jgi:hypothetical protein
MKMGHLGEISGIHEVKSRDYIDFELKGVKNYGFMRKTGTCKWLLQGRGRILTGSRAGSRGQPHLLTIGILQKCTWYEEV